MKKIINSLKRTHWFTFSIAFLTCLLYLTFPSCQKDESPLLIQESLTVLTTTAISTNTGILYYGHKIFTRSTGAPFVETLKLENPNFNCFDGNFVLKIQNGSDKKTRVSSAEIWIDGVLVVGPSDFSKNVSLITKPLSGLTPESILEVKLNSAPGSFIDLWIEGTIIVITPTFVQIGPLCQNSTAPELPLSSTNTPAITGTWSPAFSTATVGTTTYTFTPDANQCATTATMDIEVTAPVIPMFDQIGPLLQGSTAPELPTTSTIGITGTWNPANITTAALGTFTFTFTPTAGQCATTATMDIVVTNIGEVSDYQGNVYKTVKIGGQWWMAENLRATVYNDGSPIYYPGTNTYNWTNNSFHGAYAWYNNIPANGDIYGALYNWYTLDKTSNYNRNVCPTDWHVSTSAEWTTLVNFIGEPTAGTQLKESGYAHWASNGINGTDNFGFTALPGGLRDNSGGFFDLHDIAHFFTSTPEGNWGGQAEIRSIKSSVAIESVAKTYGHAVRCVKD